jgi:DNA-binding PadR family transcriptional regulator
MEFEILLSLAEGDRHGYAIMQDVSARSGDTVRPGTLYRAISRLLESTLIDEVDAGSPRLTAAADDERRRYYALTLLGRRVAALEAQRLARQVSAARSRRLLKSEG